MTDHLAPVFISVVFIVVFAVLGYILDGKLPPSLRDSILNALNRNTQGRSAGLFIALFDWLFDPDYIGRPRLGRMLLFLAVVLLLMLAGWALALPGRAENIFDYETGWLGAVISLSGILVMTNVIGCVLSLWETRLVTARMAVAGAPAQASSSVFYSIRQHSACSWIRCRTLAPSAASSLSIFPLPTRCMLGKAYCFVPLMTACWICALYMTC